MSTRAGSSAPAQGATSDSEDRRALVAVSTAAAVLSSLPGDVGGVAGSRSPVAAGGDVLQIADAEGDEADVLEVGAFVDVDSVLTSAEEAPPHRLSAEYADALFNTDPRVAFEVLHIGAMRAIERGEGMCGSHADFPACYLPPAELVRHSRDGVAPFFTVPLMHPRVRARPPLERCDHEVDELLARPSREALLSCIGPDVMDRLRFSHAAESAQRRRATARKARREGGKG